MTTKTAKANKASSKKTTTLHIATPGSGKPICGASGKGIKTTLTPAEATCSDCQKIAAHAEEKKATKKTADFAEEWGKAAANKSGDPTPKAAVQASIRAARKEAKALQSPAAAPRERDPRLPPPGTVLKKLDRAGGVRCECKVAEAGIIYKGETFRSLSAAAMAAAKDLGISGSQNGFLFWGLIRQQPRVTDPVEALQAAWDRYHERVKAIAAGELEAPTKMKISNALDRQGREIIELGSTL